MYVCISSQKIKKRKKLFLAKFEDGGTWKGSFPPPSNPLLPTSNQQQATATMSTSTASSSSSTMDTRIAVAEIPPSTQALPEMYATLKALRKTYKAQLKALEEKEEKSDFQSHSDMMIADMEWDDLDNKIYYLGKALKLIKRVMY